MPIKLLAASRKRPGLTRAEYQRYLEFYHGTIARMERFKLESYIQNHVIDGAFGILEDKSHQQIAERDAVVELSCKSFRDLMETIEPSGPSASAADGRFFAEECNNITAMVEEEEILVPNPFTSFNPGLGIVQGVGGVKVMLWIMRDEAVFPEDFIKYWREAHEYAMEKSPYTSEQLRRCQANIRSRVHDNAAVANKHFGMINPPVYDLVVNMWFDTMEQVGAFRQYYEALKTYPVKFANWSKSWYVYTKQIVIIRDTPENGMGLPEGTVLPEK